MLSSPGSSLGSWLVRGWCVAGAREHRWHCHPLARRPTRCSDPLLAVPRQKPGPQAPSPEAVKTARETDRPQRDFFSHDYLDSGKQHPSMYAHVQTGILRNRLPRVLRFHPHPAACGETRITIVTCRRFLLARRRCTELPVCCPRGGGYRQPVSHCRTRNVTRAAGVALLSLTSVHRRASNGDADSAWLALSRRISTAAEKSALRLCTVLAGIDRLAANSC